MSDNLLEHIENLITALPLPAVLLNSNNKIIYANDVPLDEKFNLYFHKFDGLGVGEVLHCVNTIKGDVCQTSEMCKFCTIFKLIRQSRQSNKSELGETNFTGMFNNMIHAYDIKLSVSPFTVNNDIVILLIIQNISSEKRKQALERIFYHDILNKSGGLSGLMQIIKDEPNEESRKELILLAENLAFELSDEIIAQRQLMQAENNDLSLTLEKEEGSELIETVVNQIRRHDVAHSKEILIDDKLDDILFKTDKIVLKRILMNMLKNALEASTSGQKITIGCTRRTPSVVRFWVKNEGFIEESMHPFIFNRSFSTKGNNRGLGTYSMKLLGEGYLRGIVDFFSDKNIGTVFYIELPIVI